MSKPGTVVLKIILAGWLAAGAVHAAPVTWTLRDVVFNDGTTAAGSFVYDAHKNTYVNFSITTTSGNAYGDTYRLNPGGSRNLLTLAEETLYYNTNLGAVASLSTHDGAVRWINLYPRAQSVDLSRRAAHFYRDLTPCVYHQGVVYVAPSDSQQLFALDATTGRRLWASTLPTDAVHLLGVGGSHLIASGDHLWWLETSTGKVVRRWPDTEDAARGFGRGMIAGDEIYWPTRDVIHVFSCTTTEQTQQPIRLTPRGAGGGNLLLVQGYLLIAASDTLYGFLLRPAVR